MTDRDVKALAKRLWEMADRMDRFTGPPEMAPGPISDDLREAAATLLSAQEKAAALRDALMEAKAGFGDRMAPALRAKIDAALSAPDSEEENDDEL